MISLVAAIWAATQYQQAPPLILLALLYLIAYSFTMPLSHGGLGLVPLVSVCSLLVVDLSPALLLMVVSMLLSLALRPLWNPVEELASVTGKTRSWRGEVKDLLEQSGIYVFALFSTGFFYRFTGDDPSPSSLAVFDLRGLLLIAALYGSAYLASTFLLWLVEYKSWQGFPTLSTAGVGILIHPFAFAGAIAYYQSGLPTFVVFCLAVTVAALTLWLGALRRFTLEERLSQFEVVNIVGKSLREVLDLDTVLSGLRQQVGSLLSADSFFIALLNEDGTWIQPVYVQGGQQPLSAPWSSYQPDDFTRWVGERGRPLVLSPQTMRFARRHDLNPPTPLPAAWMGVPLSTAKGIVGVMVMQRFSPGQPFDRWSQEVLLSIAGQASAAIQNAQLYSETLRLYNLTDEALSQRLNQLQALLNAMEEGVLMLDTGGRILLVNPSAAKLLDDNPETLTGKQVDIQQHATLLGYGRSELASLLNRLARGQLRTGDETTFQQQLLPGREEKLYPARRFWMRVDTPVRNEDQELIGWLMLFRDVTEERKLAELRADMTRMIVHDLRNPLTTLSSTVNLIADRLSSTSQGEQIIHELLAQARLSGDDMLDMVDSLMDVSRLEEGQPVVEPDALHMLPLLVQVLDRLQPLARQKGIDLNYEAAENLPPVWADCEMLRRILTNLLDNALKFTPHGGSVSARLTPTPPSSDQQAAGVRCAIQDSGPGVPPEFRHQLFNRFMRTNPGGAQVRGTGLGLAFCKMAIEAHHGSIWVEDAPEGGSCFIFTLPGTPLVG